MKDISIILPWRGNPDLLYKTVADLTDYNYPVKLFIIFDGEKEEFIKFPEDIYGIEITKILSPEPIEFVAATNLGYSAAKDSGDIFMIWACDCVIDNPSWYDDMIASYEMNFPNGGGLLCANDGYWNGKIAIHPIVDKKFIEWLEYPDNCILWPEYIHYGSDNEITERARSSGRYAYDMELKYHHPSPTERLNYRSIEHKDHDGKLLKQRRISGWPNGS